MNGKEVVLPLPECPREEMGTSRSKHKHFKARFCQRPLNVAKRATSTW